MKLSNVDSNLKVIDGNPLAVRGSPGRGQSQLALVWSNPVSEKTAREARRVARETVARGDPPRQSWTEQHQGVLTLISLALSVITTLYVIAFSFGVWSTKLDQMSEDMTDLKTRAHKLEQAVTYWQGKFGDFPTVSYEEQAEALHFPRTATRIAQISSSPTAPPRLSLKGTKEGTEGQVSYDLEIIFETFTSEYIFFELSDLVQRKPPNGPVWTMELTGNHIGGQLRSKEPVNLKEVINGFVSIPELPDIWIAVIDRPSEDKAVIALGPRTQGEQKAS